jgi:hypothetical protein
VDPEATAMRRNILHSTPIILFVCASVASCGSSRTTPFPEKLGEPIVVVSDPSGVLVGDYMKPLGRTPLTIHRKPSELPGVLTQVVITSAATAPDQCSQVRFIGFDRSTPDTVHLDMHRCLTINQDFSRVFAPDELERMPERINGGYVDLPTRQPGREAFVIAEVVVDSAGYPEAPTFRILAAGDSALVPRVQSAILGSFYRPGEAAGHRVRVRLQIPIGVTIRS